MEMRAKCVGIDFYTSKKTEKRYAKLHCVQGIAQYGYKVSCVYVPVTDNQQENAALDYINEDIIILCDVVEYGGERRLVYRSYKFAD